MPKTALARFSGWPARSIATMVLAKSGGWESLAMPSTSASSCAIPSSMAVLMSATLNLPKGGTPPKGPSQGASSGLSLLATADESFTNLSANRSCECVLLTVESAFQSRGSDGLRKKSRSEEHTSELQSQSNLVCRLLLEKNK